MNWKSVGATLAAVAVALGAFGAHGLQGRVSPELLEVYKTGSHYLMIHALAIVLFGLSGVRKSWPGLCFLGGILFFCGSLFGIVATGIRMLGAITPIGGVLFIAGWVGFALLTRKEA